MAERKQPRQVDEYRWRAFVAEYVKDFNGTRAYFDCGCYKPKDRKSAEIGAIRLLTNPNVQQYINEATEAISERTAVTADKIVREYARLGFFNIKSVVEWDDDGMRLLSSRDISDDDSATVMEPFVEIEEFESEEGTRRKVRKKLKTHSKYPALEMLSKYVDLFGDRARGDAFVSELGEGLSRLINYTVNQDGSGSNTEEDGSKG